MAQLGERIVAGQLAVGEAARSSDEVPDLLRRVATAAMGMVGAQAVAFWQIDPEGRARIAGMAGGPLAADAASAAPEMASRLTGSGHVTHHSPSGAGADEIVAVRWSGAAPDDGICCAYGPQRPAGFEEEDALLLEVISNSCGNVAQRQVILDRLRRTMDDLHAAEDRLRRVLDLIQALTAVGDPEALLEELTRGAMELVGAEAGFAGLRRTEGVVAHALYRRNLTEPFSATWQPGQGIPGWCLRTGGSYATEDLARDPLTGEVLRRLGAHRIICAAIVDARGDVLGFLALLDKPTAFDADDRRVQEVLASSAAPALRNAIAYQRLGELEEFKSDFLNLAAHELRGPVAIARGYLEMLADDPERWDGSQRRSMLRVSTQKLDQIRLLVEQMLETARVDERPPLNFEVVDLRALVRSAIGDVSDAIRPEHRVTVRVADSPIEVRVDVRRIRTAIANLVENACKYSPQGGTITIRATVGDSLEGTPGWALVEIEDQGLGIAAADLPRLFTRFGRILNKQNSGIPGTGLGLYLSQQLARVHGGEISVESEPGQGSRFCLRLPLLPAEPARARKLSEAAHERK